MLSLFCLVLLKFLFQLALRVYSNLSTLFENVSIEKSHKSRQSCPSVCLSLADSGIWWELAVEIKAECNIEGRSQDGGGVGRGDHSLFYKFIERTTER